MIPTGLSQLFSPLVVPDSLRPHRLQPQRRQWQSTPVLLPGKSHGWRRLVGCSPWDRKESDTTERLHFHFSLSTFMLWRRKWQPTPVSLPGESQGRGSLVGCRLWGRTESDTTEATQQQQQQYQVGRSAGEIIIMDLAGSVCNSSYSFV